MRLNKIKFDTNSLILLLIACMLAFVAYQSIDLVKGTTVFAKLNLFQANKGGITREQIDAMEL